MMVYILFNRAYWYVQYGTEMEVTGLLSFPFVLAQGEVKSFYIPGSHLGSCYAFFL